MHITNSFTGRWVCKQKKIKMEKDRNGIETKGVRRNSEATTIRV